MRKIYYCLLLLLAGHAAYAQNPLLTRILTVPDSTLIMDYGYNKVFLSKEGDSIYHIMDVSTGAATLIPFNRRLSDGYPAPYVKLTPYGAVFTANSNTGPIFPYSEPVLVYEWHEGTLSLLDSIAYNMQAAGNYAIWLHYDTAAHFKLFLRDLASGQQAVLDSNVREAVVAGNGLVVYTKYQAVYKYRNGVKTLVTDTNTPGIDFFYPRTDGEHIAYVSNLEGEIASLVLDDGTAPADTIDLVVSVSNGEYTVSDAAPKMRNGYMAGVRPVFPWYPNPEFWIWSRDRQGMRRDLAYVKGATSPFGAAGIAALDTAGNMAVSAKARDTLGFYYFSRNGSVIKRIFDDSYNRVRSHMYAADGGWVITSSGEHAVYKVNIDSTFDHHILPFELKTLPQTRVRFTEEDFIQHYTGPDTGKGQLLMIYFTELPRHGVLVAKDNRVINAGSNYRIPRADLDSLQYSPYGGFTGRDTIAWRAYDGLSWTNDTIIYIQVSPAPPMDSIRPFDKNTLAGTPIHFTADDFVQHYSGRLQRVSITALPPYGKLTVGGKAVFYERSRELTLAELDSLVYTPKAGIAGVDTFQWKAFNGSAWTNYDTAAVLHIYPVLDAPPAVRTLQPLYLSNAAPSRIWIVNYPPDRWHTTVRVQVDNAAPLPVAADHTFLLDPAAYAPGAHTLRVTFTHPLDTVSLSRYFAIVPWPPFQLNAQGKLLSATTEREEGPAALRTWPNPFDQQFTLSGLEPSSTYILELFDQQGKLVMSRRITGSGRELITTSGIPGKGLYLLQVRDENRKITAGTFKLLRL
ncbi:T9SS type A sorting domain-containing protein [Chitinophaga japonensis]|uniref:Putative secreted protein (Por secretion system target) n=1 Tax=Chitinophaga japonensis TaxID=104662 RepID=A0A562T030_CHIJA|nr:T9SS type A sorting domain-containing protein [Chitinophaga japonensis]TWI86614.1 putative secreted protein (Por secretion system target) [Chitinophaga japonensis]